MKKNKRNKINKKKLNWWKFIVRIGVVVSLIVGIIEFVHFFLPKKEEPSVVNTVNNSKDTIINIAETINIDEMQEDSEPYTVFNDVALSYINQQDDRIRKHLYPLNFDDLSQYEKKYSVTDNCFTSLLVSNNSKHEYQITKLSFYASNIEKDYSPYFEEL